MNGNPNVPHGSDFQSLMNYRLQLARKGNGLLDRARIASMMDIQDNTLYKHAAGLIPTNCDFARNLNAAVAKLYPEDLEFQQFFIPDGYHVVKDDKVIGVRCPDTLPEVMAELSDRTAGVLRDLVRFAPNGYDSKEKKTILAKIARMKQYLAEIGKSIQEGE